MTTLFYTPNSLQDIVQHVLEKARYKNLSGVAVDVQESSGLSVSVRDEMLESVQHHHDKEAAITVYLKSPKGTGFQIGNARGNDFSEAGLEQLLQAARQIAEATQVDSYAGLAEASLLYRGATDEMYGDLEIYHPHELSVDEAVNIGCTMERTAKQLDRRISNSEGANISTGVSQAASGHSNGFLGYTRSSGHYYSFTPIAQDGDDMQQDYWYTSNCNFAKLAPPEAVGKYSAERSLSRLYARSLTTQTCPVIFEAPLAIGLLGGLTQALSGTALYQRQSFLLDSLGQKIFPEDIQVVEDPFLKGAVGSGYFDAEGVRTKARRLINDGVVEGYFLNSYSARRLNLHTTGNAGGSHNLRLFSTKAVNSLKDLLQQMDKGFFVTGLMGMGVNYVTGDYSQGAFGYWVENGTIQYPVSGATIAGNLKDMLRGIVGVAKDDYTRGKKTAGSILINQMRVASV